MNAPPSSDPAKVASEPLPAPAAPSADGPRQMRPARAARGRTIGFVALILLLLIIIGWTETVMWSRIDRMRGGTTAVSPESIEALHRAQTWSSVLLLAAGGALAVLVYRGLVAPLQERLRQTQRVIERQEKLSSLGILAAGVAHEIRNPLTSIKVRLFTQQQLLRRGSEEFEDNVFLTGEISRLEKIVKDFLAFARPSDPELVPMRATAPLRDLRPLMEPALRRQKTQLREEFLADPIIRADAAQLKQVLINLVTNASEAMPAGGMVTLRTRLEGSTKAGRGRAWAVLEVADNGPGVPPEVAQRLFDPFFTTKATGTGLGLSIAARIIEKHGGTLEFSTQLNRGTTFRILLPVDSNHDNAQNLGH